MTSRKPTGSKFDISPLTIVKAFWNGKLLAAVIAAIVIVVGGFVVRRLPAVYQAEVLILVDSQKIPERFVSTTVTAQVQDRLTTISQEILSSTNLLKIIQDFDLYREERKALVQEEIVEKMRRDVEVKVERAGGGSRPGAFRISYRSANPITVAQVANRIANLYIEENLRTRENQAEGTSEFIEQQLEQAKNQLDQLETTVSEYKIHHNGELPQQESSLNGALGRLQMELSGVQDALNRGEQNKMVLQNSLEMAENSEATIARSLQRSTAIPATPDAPVLVSPSIARRPSRADELAVQLQSLRIRYSNEHPDVRRAVRELERVRALEEQALAEEAKANNLNHKQSQPPSQKPEPVAASLVTPELLRARERTATLRTQMSALDREIARLHAERSRILRDIASYQSRVERLPLREQEMAALTRDYEISKGHYRSLLDKKIAAEMASELERRQKAEKFTILDPARVPEKPAKPNRMLLYAVVTVAGTVLGIVSAVGRELLRDRFLGEWELPKEIAVLARVPHIALSPTAFESGADAGTPVPNRVGITSAVSMTTSLDR